MKNAEVLAPFYSSASKDKSSKENENEVQIKENENEVQITTPKCIREHQFCCRKNERKNFHIYNLSDIFYILEDLFRYMKLEFLSIKLKKRIF